MKGYKGVDWTGMEERTLFNRNYCGCGDCGGQRKKKLLTSNKHLMPKIKEARNDY